MTSQDSLLATMMSSRFDEPIDMLLACHKRVLEMLGLLQRLGDHLDQIGADATARQAARDLVRFFDLAAVHHFNDEELHVVPLLRSLGEHAVTRRLLDEHCALAADWARIREGLNNLSVQADELREGLVVRRANWLRFASDYRAHIVFEEGEVFTKIDAVASASQHARIGAAMARRRGAPL
jgi:hemerythrin-like domain-containing protein